MEGDERAARGAASKVAPSEGAEVLSEAAAAEADVVCWLRGRVARVDCGGAAGAARGAEAVYSTFLFKRTRTMKFPK